MFIELKPFAIWCVALSVGCLISGASRAGFIEVQVDDKVVAPDKGRDTPDRFDREWTWDFSQVAETWPPNADTPKPKLVNWDVELSSTAQNQSGLKMLTLEADHLIGPHKADTNPNPNKFTKTLSLARPREGAVQFAGATNLVHPTTNSDLSHFDLFRYSVTLGKSGGTIEMHGLHLREPGLTYWSYKAFEHGKITIIPSYPDDTTGAPIGPQEVTQGREITGKLPVKQTANALLPPSDFTVTFEGSGHVNTTLAFLGDTVGGLGELDLNLAAQLFVGNDAFLAPAFFTEPAVRSCSGWFS
jgi:hypothetical protein